MTGPEHYALAVRLVDVAWDVKTPDLSQADPWASQPPAPVPAHSPEERDAMIGTTQVHATLALAAATTEAGGISSRRMLRNEDGTTRWEPTRWHEVAR